MTIRELLKMADGLFLKSNIDSAALDAEALLAFALQKDRAFIIAHPEYTANKNQERQYRTLISMRAKHVPFAYLVGKKEFFGHEFIVDTYTLIPRPETEILIQSVLDYLNQGKERKYSILDVGTGSGCIIISIALHAENVSSLWAIDRVKRALDVARKNAELYGLAEKIVFKRYNMLSLIREKFDIIVANLPYVSSNELADAKKVNPELEWEPQIALLGGKDGLLFNTKLLQQTRKHLTPGGALFFEIDPEQSSALQELSKKYLSPCTIEIKKDLCGRDRVVCVYTKVSV